MKQRENVVLRSAFCALAYRGIQILEPRKWNREYVPPFRPEDDAIKGVAWRNNTGLAIYGRQAVSFGIKGAPDIVGMLRGGRYFGLECKRPGEGPSDWQRWYHQFFGGLGMLVGVVHSYDEAVETLNGWGIN